MKIFVSVKWQTRRSQMIPNALPMYLTKKAHRLWRSAGRDANWRGNVRQKLSAGKSLDPIAGLHVSSCSGCDFCHMVNTPRQRQVWFIPSADERCECREIPWERVPYLSALLEVCSRWGAIQIHVYLYLYLYVHKHTGFLILLFTCTISNFEVSK